MKYFQPNLLSIFLSICLINKLYAIQCIENNMIIRKNWDDLNETERQTLQRTIHLMKTEPKQKFGNLFNYDDFVGLHMKVGLTAHFVAAFLPWHRLFTFKFEQHLRRITPGISLPYWDWGRDDLQYTPHKLDVFSGKYFGTKGNLDGFWCLEDGFAANWTTVYPKTNTDVACVRRQWDRGQKIGSFWGNEMMDTLIERHVTYQGFRDAFENGPHFLVHNNVGGTNGDLRQLYSPNDPLFWIHHANVDRIWLKWQNKFGIYQYEGPKIAGQKELANLTDVLDLFGVKVINVMNINELCYKYE